MLALALLAGCATDAARDPPVLVTACRDGDAVRVQFRLRDARSTGHRARLAADGGRLTGVLHSPDLLTVSVRWEEAAGTLSCAFPYHGQGRFDAGGAVQPGRIEYVFFQGDGVEVTGTVPAGCPMQARLSLQVRVMTERLPARLDLPDGTAVALTEEDTACEVELPRDENGVLSGGDVALSLHVAGEEHLFLIGVDADGVPAATSGFVQKW